ncbi:MAG: NAD(P)/FAD-dependent oxidoreductase [Proteobacteria bacterium]|nr:NAD(P)/FAD-dependent oxidoreductase [Pseudomonadota bacterium]
MADDTRSAVIAGAGPAGLTAAYELLRRSNVRPLVFEADEQVGGLSKTVNYRGNRLDLGGHRFFSKSDWVMKWWQDILPVHAPETQAPLSLTYQQQQRSFAPEETSRAPDGVMLVRERLSRIFYGRRFFDYPLKLNGATLHNLGLLEALRIGASYGQAKLRTRTPEHTLEDFLVNRFGERLYRTFFKDYTEKVWGVPCREISAEWGAQRIKGLSISKAIANAISSRFHTGADPAQKRIETSLIEHFLYPTFGPGQMWEAVARRVRARGGEVHLSHRVIGLECEGHQVRAVQVRDAEGGVRRVPCDYFISTLPVRELVAFLGPEDTDTQRIASQLPYRDFMTAGLLLKRMRFAPDARARIAGNGMPPDNWIYIQEPDVKIGRLQVFNNWSPAMVADPSTIWLGLEYFCREGDELWSMADGAFLAFAARELEQISMIDRRDVLDGTLIRVSKAYPAYFGEYRHFGRLRDYLDRFSNLFPAGRNGMHRYNNQDHSMLAANVAVSAIAQGSQDKSAIWQINAEEDYHEAMGPAV